LVYQAIQETPMGPTYTLNTEGMERLKTQQILFLL